MGHYLRGMYLAAIMLASAEQASAQKASLQHYTIRDGLPSNKIYCGIQDSRGFIWLGTDNGLVRFDGSAFKVFTIKDGLPDNDIFTVFEDHQGRLWVLGSKQAPCYFLNGRLHTEANDSFLAKYFKGAEMFRFTSNTYHRRLIFYVVWNGHFTAIEYGRQPHPMMFIGSPKQGLHGGTFMLYVQDGTDYLIDGNVVYNMTTRQVTNHMLTGGFMQGIVGGKLSGLCNVNEDTVYRFTLERDRLVLGKMLTVNGKPIHTSRQPIYEDAGGMLYKISGDSVEAMHMIQLPAGVYYSRIFEDREGNWWLPTRNNGLYVWSKHAAAVISDNEEANALAYVKTSKTLVSGFETKKLLICEHGGDPAYMQLPQKRSYLRRVTSLLSDGDKVYVGGDFQFGALNLATRQFDEYYSAFSGSLLTYNKDIEKCDDGKIILASTFGAGIFDPAAGVMSDSIWNTRTTSVCHVSGYADFLGTVNGLYFRKAGVNEVQLFASYTAMDHSRISDIRADNMHRIWVGTAQSGLFVIDGKVVRHLSDDRSEQAALSSYCIKQIYFDEKGNSWICTDRGLDKVELRHDGRFIVKHIQASFGSPGNHVNACVVTEDTIYLATLEGVIRMVNTENMNSEIPGLEITGIYVNNINREIPGSLSLPFDSNSISIEYAAIAFHGAGNIEFLFRLADEGGKWNKTNNKRIDLLSLRPGTYRFEIVAINRSTGLSSPARFFVFTIRSPWYSTWWFYLLCVILVVAVIMLLVRARINKVKRLSEELTNINKHFAELEMQALRAQMNPHFIFNAMSAIQHYFVSNDEEKANAYMSRFAQLIRQMLDYSQHNFIPLDEEIKLLRNYMELETMRFNGRISFDIQTDDFLIQEDYRLPSLLLQPLLENAVNHGLRNTASAGLVSLRFSIVHEQLVCIINDNGVGIKHTLDHKAHFSGQHHSQGMEITRKRIESVNYLYNTNVKMDIYDTSDLEPGKTGTRIVIGFPLTLVSASIQYTR